MVASLLLPLSGANVTVKVHPVVLLQVCDAYIRRSDKQERVIGTLLGTSSEGAVNISRCYVVPHNESADQVRRLCLARWANSSWRRLLTANFPTGCCGHSAPQDYARSTSESSSLTTYRRVVSLSWIQGCKPPAPSICSYCLRFAATTTAV